MGIKSILKNVSIISLSMVTTFVYAFPEIDTNAIWPAVVQGHHQNETATCSGITGSQLTMNNSSRINGTLGNPLAFCSINDGSGLPSDSCDTAAGGDRKCDITSNDINGLDLTGSNEFQTSDGSNGGIGFCNAGDSLTLGNSGDNQFNSISLFSSCTLTFSNSQNEYFINNINIGSGSEIILSEGDYWVNSMTIGQNSSIVLAGNVRIFVNSGSLNGGRINETNDYKLQLISYNGLSMTSGAIIGGQVYTDSSMTMYNNNTAVNGRVTARYLTMGGTSSVNDVEPPTNDSFHIQYGKATSESVTFDTPFPDGVTPLVFLMPTIEQSNTNNDGPASVFLNGTPSTTGFSWVQLEPESGGNRYVESKPMTEVHWVAVNAGTHDLSNGTQLIAGTVEIDSAHIGSNNSNDRYVDVDLPSSQNVLLNQIQTQVNNCWLTSLSQFNNTGIRLAMDTSEVRSNNSKCQPGDLNNNQIDAETVAYLSLESGSGSIVLNSENLNYHFGQAQTFTAGNIQDLDYQCNLYFRS